jgi:hypothetical protein
MCLLKIRISRQTFEGYLFLRVVKLIVPTFLLKCLEVLNAFREKDSIEVYIYQIIEILQHNSMYNGNAEDFMEQMTEAYSWLFGITLVFVEATG